MVLKNKMMWESLSRMSHDIRTPINVIKGMTELAMQEENRKQVDRYLTNIQSSGKFLLGLVNDILDLNKVESGKMELHLAPYRYSDFKNYIDAVIVPLCQEKDINFEMISKKEEMIFMLDGLRLNQIFFNLLSNAVKFTAPKGHIVFECVATEVDNQKGGLDFSIQDDGIGMSKEFQERMFEAFSQEERIRTQQGTGLGLVIVKRLVELMNGTIKVQSEEGKGTTFFVHIEAEMVSADDVPQAREHKKVDLAGKNILLCEDYALNAESIVRILEKVGMSVDVAENG